MCEVLPSFIYIISMATIDNTIMAKILLANKLASKEILLEVLKDVTPQSDVGQILVEAGLLSEAVYQKVRTVVVQYQRQQEQKAAETLPERVPEDGLAIPIARTLEETQLGSLRETDGLSLDGGVTPTAFDLELDGDQTAQAADLKSALIDADGMEIFRARMMGQEFVEITSQMEEIDNLLFEMASRGEISWEQAARRCFDKTRFPEP